MMDTLTIVAIVISSITILVTLAKINRQLDHITGLFKTTNKKLWVSKSKDDLTSSQLQRKLHELNKEIKTMKGDIDWKG